MSWLPGIVTRARLAAAAVVALAMAVVLVIWLGASGGGAGTPRPGRAALAPGTIMTVAGGVGGPGPATTVAISTCPISYADGALYAGDGSVIRRIDTRTGWLTTPAGDGTTGDHGNGVLATDAGLSAGGGTPTCSMSASLDAAGNMLITAGQLHVVAARTGTFYGLRMIAKHIYRIPQPYFAGSDVRADRAGNLVTIETDSQPCGSECSVYPGLVRVLAERTGTFYGVSMLAGHVYTLAGSDEEATATGNGGPAARAGLGALAQLSLDAAGNLLIADEGRPNANAPGGIPSEIRVLPARDGTFYGQRMLAGDIYSIAGGGRRTASGMPAISASIGARGVTHDAAGNVIIGDGSQLRVVAARDGRFYGIAMKAGDIYTVAGAGHGYHSSGDGGPAAKARMDAEFVAVDGAGNLAFTDGNTSKIRVVAVHPGTFYGIAMKAGDIYSVAGTSGATAGNTLPGFPAGVASDASGDLIIGYQYGTASGPQFRPARPGTYFGIPMKPGRLYQIPTAGTRFGRCPGAVAADRFGNVLIADQSSNRLLVAPVRSGTFYGQRMRAGRIYPVAGDGKASVSGNGQPIRTGRIYRPPDYGKAVPGVGGPALAASLSPAWVAADRRGDVFAADPDNRVMMVPARSGTFYGTPMTAGHIYTVAGDGTPGGHGAPAIGNAVPATHTDMSPFGVTVDAAGNLVLATDDRVRVVALRTGRFYGVSMKAGYIYTVAGPFPGTHAVAVDGHGNILVDDAVANVVRLVAIHSGTFYGQHVTAGHDYVIAGHQHGQAGLGEDGPATQAWLDGPDAIAVAPDGRLLIAVSSGQRILAVTP